MLFIEYVLFAILGSLVSVISQFHTVRTGNEFLNFEKFRHKTYIERKSISSCVKSRRLMLIGSILNVLQPF